MENAEFLQFGWTDIQGPGLASLKNLDKVHHLWVYHTRIDDAGLAYIPAFAKLEAVNLDSTSISDSGVRCLRKLTGLREWHVEHTRVTGDGLSRLHESLPDCTFYADPAAMEEYCTSVLAKEPENVALNQVLAPW